MDLNATYTHTYAGHAEPVTLTPKVETRTRYGVATTTITHLAPLLADQINAIDEHDRLHVLEALNGQIIVICDEDDYKNAEGHDQTCYYRDHGRLTTTYRGAKGLPVETVLDLAEALRTELAEAN